MTLSEAYEDWRSAEDAYTLSKKKKPKELMEVAGNADAAFEQMSAIAFQQGYDPAGPLGIVEFVMREIAK